MLTLCICCLSGCYNDDKLWDAVNDVQYIEGLKDWQKIVDSNIEALHTLVNVTGCVVETTPIVLGGETIGHTIWTANRTPVTIYKGKDDAMPMISLTQNGDKKWYWTLNGKLIKDVQGNPVCANGHAAGEYVPKPQLKAGVNMTVDTENTPIDKKAFYMSIDDGKSWITVPRPDKGNGYAPFARVIDKESSVEILMNDEAGSVLELLKELKAKVIFETNENGNIEIKNSAHLTIAYRTENVDDDSWLLFEGTNGLSVLDNNDGTVTLVLDEMKLVNSDLIVTVIRQDEVLSKIKYAIEFLTVLTDLQSEYYITEPQVLESVGGKVHATIKGIFPALWFDTNAIVTITPFMKWNGGVVKGRPIGFQGEMVEGDNQRISFLRGGNFTIKTGFEYIPEMAKSELYLEVLIQKGKEESCQLMKIADGVILYS